MLEHPAGVARDPRAQLVRAERSGRAHRREDAATRRVQLFVACTPGPKGELVDPVAAERRVGMAVDEARDRAEPTPVELLELTVEPRQVAHAPDRLDPVSRTEDERIVDDVDGAERGASAGRGALGGRCELRQVAHQEPRRCGERRSQAR